MITLNPRLVEVKWDSLQVICSPVFVEFNNGNNRFQNTSYAPLGLIVRSGLGTSPSYTSVSPTGAVDGVNNGFASCADLDAGIQSAENDLRAFEDSKLGRLNKLMRKIKDT